MSGLPFKNLCREKTAAISPLQNKAAENILCQGNSVEAHWPPLTPEHGFPSLHVWLGPRALPLSPLPVCTGTPEISFLHLLTILSKNKENGGPHARRLSVSEKTPSGGMIRIR